MASDSTADKRGPRAFPPLRDEPDDPGEAIFAHGQPLEAPRYWGPLDVPARVAGLCFALYAALRVLGWW